MNFDFREFFLKAIPYVASFCGGVLLFLLSKGSVKNPDVMDLMTNISASLLSIPVVFLLYDYTNYRISKKLQKTLTETTNEKLDVLLLSLILLFRQILNIRKKLTFASLNKMSGLSVSYIERNLKVGAIHLNTLHKYHDYLEELIYRSAKSGILSAEQLQSLSELAREILRMENEYKFSKDKRNFAKHISEVIKMVSDWLDSDASVAIRFQKLLGTAGDKNEAETEKYEIK